MLWHPPSPLSSLPPSARYTAFNPSRLFSLTPSHTQPTLTMDLFVWHQGKPAKAGLAVRNALVLSLGAGLLLAAALQVSFPSLLALMGCGADALPAAVAYSAGRGWSVPFVMMVAVGQVRARGSSVTLFPATRNVCAPSVQRCKSCES
jgi:hypothetical protein